MLCNRLVSDPRTALHAATATTLFASFVTGKALAVTGGPSAVGVQAAVVVSSSLTALLGTWAAANSIPRLAGQTDAAGSDFALAAFKATAVALPLAVPLAWITILPELLESYSALVALGGLALASLSAVLAALLPTLLAVFTDSLQAAKYQLVAAVVGTVTLIGLIFALGQSSLPAIIGAALLVGQIVALLVMNREWRAWAHQRKVPFKWYLQQSLPILLSTAVGFGASALASLLIIRWNGTDFGGLYRAAGSMSGIPAAVLASSINLHYYPQVAERLAAQESTAQLTLDSVRSLSQRAVIVSIFLGVAAPLMMWLFYSPSFLEAAGALTVMLVGGLLRLLSLHNAFLLLAGGKRRAYFGAEATAAVTLVTGVTAVAHLADLTLTALASLLSGIAYYLVTLFLLRRQADRGAVASIVPRTSWVAIIALMTLAVAWSYFF